MKKLTFLFTLLCASAMTWAYDIAPNTNFWGDHNFQWQEIAGVTAPANVVNVQSKNGFDCLYITFADAAFNRDHIVGGTVYTDAGAQAWLKLESFTNQYTDVLFYQTGSTTDVRWGLRIYNPNGATAASCASNHVPVVSAVSDASNITYNSAQVTITASDEDGDDITYVIKNGDAQIASSSTSTITISGLASGTTYNSLKAYAVDVCGTSVDNENNTITSFSTPTRPSECSGDLGHFGNPSVKRISYTIEYLPIIDKIKYTVRGKDAEVLTYLEIHTTEGNSGSVAITDGVAIWLQSAPESGTDMAIRFLYGVESIGDGREMNSESVSLNDAQTVYYKSHDCETISAPVSVPTAAEGKNDCQVYSIFGTEGFSNHATHAEAWDGAKSYLTGTIDGKAVYYTTAGTTANIQYPSQNINAYDKLHFDIWTDAAREIGVELCINAGTHGSKQNIMTTASSWKSVDLDLTGFHADKNVNTTFFFLSSLARATYYVTNVYLYKTAADESCYADLNLALGKPVAAGYTPGNAGEAPSKVNDGNEGTQWTTWQNQPAANEWWYVDLGRAYQLTRIDVLFGNDISNNYILQTRLDAPTLEEAANDAAWTTVATVTDAIANTKKSSTINCAARYVRFHSLSRTNVDLIRLNEIEIYGSGIADVDTEKPVMTSASLNRNTHNKVILNVAATDNKGIAAYHVVESTHGIDTEISPEDGKIAITGLTAETSYTFIITAKDFFDNESDNSKSVTVTTNAYSAVPTVAAPTPTWPANQVKSLYSDTYTFAPTSLSSYNEGWFNPPTLTEEAIAGNHYLKYNGTMSGMVGWQFSEISVSTMEYVHVDIWPSEDGSITMGPTSDGSKVASVTRTVEANRWNSIDIPLSALQAANAEFDPAKLFQNQFTGYSAQSVFSVDNVYFYRTTPPPADETAPTDVTASVTVTSFTFVKISAQANDDSGIVLFKVLNGSTELVSDVEAVSGTATTITVNGLNPNTAYSLKVVAFDEAGHEAAPVVVAATTLTLPSAAPQPSSGGKIVLSVYSDAFTPAVAASFRKTNWSSAPVAWTADYLLYTMSSNVIVWGNNDGNAGYGNIDGLSGHTYGANTGLDVSKMKYLHFDVWCDAADQLNTVNINDVAVSIPTTRTVAGEWVSFDVDITGVALADRQNVRWLKFHPFNAANCNAAIDNVYFWSYGVTTNQDNWSSFACAYDVQIPSGITAYKAAYEVVEGNEQLTLTSIGSVIPANTGVILRSADPNTTHVFTITDPVEVDLSGNDLVGCAVRTDISAVHADYDVFCLRRSDLYDQTGFFLYTGQYIPAGKAYLKLAKESGTPAPERRLRLVINETETTTAIDHNAADITATKFIHDGQLFIRRGDTIYTIQGVLVK